MSGRPFKPVSKYRAQRTDGYASKREAAYAHHLGLLKASGKITDWLEQVPIKLPGGIRYVVDFMVIDQVGVRFVEVKGFFTPAAKMKLRLLEESRPEIFKRLEIVK